MGKEGVSLPYLADAVIVVIFLLFIILGVKRGFVRSVLDLVGTLAAMLVSMWFSGIAAQWFFSTFLQESLTRQIAEALQSAPAADAAEAVLSVVPEILRGGLEAFGITSDAINQAVAGTSGQAAAAVVAVLSPRAVCIGAVCVPAGHFPDSVRCGMQNFPSAGAAPAGQRVGHSVGRCTGGVDYGAAVLLCTGADFGFVSLVGRNHTGFSGLSVLPVFGSLMQKQVCMKKEMVEMKEDVNGE